MQVVATPTLVSFNSVIASVGSGLSKVVQVATPAIDSVGASFGELFVKFLDGLNLGFSSIRHGFFGMRIPFIYMEYFVHDAAKDTALKLSGYILYLFGEIGLGAQWLHHLGLLDLSQISAAIGNIGVLGSLGVSSLDAGLGIISGIASVLFSIDYVIKLCQDNLSTLEVVKIGFGLVSCLVHILAIAIFFASLGALFEVAVGLTLFSCALYIVHWSLDFL